MIVLTSLMAASSVFLFSLWYLRNKNQQEERIRSLGEQQRMIVEQHASFGQRVVFPTIDTLVNILLAVLPTALIARARRWLVIAGDKYSISQFLTIVLVTSTALPAAYFVVAWIGSSASLTGNLVIPIPFLALIGLLGPFFVLRRSARNRQRKIWKSMPSTLDLMTTCVEAGLSLDFALQRVADQYEGPLSDEIQRMLREIGLGKTRRQALIDMANRIELPDLMTFVNSIVQAESLGTSVGQVLRIQAGQMRLKRRQRAEQIARQAPVKMVFPLVFCMMPSLFIVTIGPVVLNVIKAFKEF